ncbi:MAG TPA: DUF1697 domain-containing protein [Pyrinomonadaceae bacterium]|nr:DUF1697 domain-containing protein [Pyrinomonadaceae bacterium]
MSRKSKSSASIFVALLRGVNVGGKNMIRMSSLKDSFERTGFREVTTYINSGNIIFRASEGDAREMERMIEGMLSREYELECKVVVRSFSEMAELVMSLPETWDGDRAWKYNVIFLRHSIDSENILDVLKPASGIEQIVYRPGTLLWSARISGMNRTSMLKLPGQKLFQEMTVRNTNTTKKLYELMKKMADE